MQHQVNIAENEMPVRALDRNEDDLHSGFFLGNRFARINAISRLQADLLVIVRLVAALKLAISVGRRMCKKI